jgi:hypothetical protein
MNKRTHAGQGLLAVVLQCGPELDRMMRSGLLACVLLTALAGCSTTGGILGGGGSPTVAACIPVVLQDAQNIHQLEAGLTAVAVAPVTVMPPPVMTQPPPVVVTMPTTPGAPPIVTPAPMPTMPTPSGPGGPIVTPNRR